MTRTKPFETTTNASKSPGASCESQREREREREREDIETQMESWNQITDKKQHTRLGNIFIILKSFSRPVFLYSSIAKKGVLPNGGRRG